MLHFALLLVFAFNFQEDPSVNLLVILLGAGILQVWAWMSGGVYTDCRLDALEGLFSLNLIVLVGVTLYNVNHSKENMAAWYTSVTVTFVAFIGILAYHTFLRLKQTKLWKKVPKLNVKFNKLSIKRAMAVFSSPQHLREGNTNPDDLNHSYESTPNNTVTHTEVDLCKLQSPLDLLETK